VSYDLPEIILVVNLKQHKLEVDHQIDFWKIIWHLKLEWWLLN